MPTGIDNARDAVSAVWAKLWNPPTDDWSPSDEPYNVVGDGGDHYGQPSHFDMPHAEPVSEEYGQAPSGTTPDVRLNLIDSIRQHAAEAIPTAEVHHYLHNVEKSSDLVRARTVHIADATSAVVLLDENPGRSRALIKITTTAAVIAIAPARSGGNSAAGTGITGNRAAFLLATGDPMLEVKAGAAVEAYGVTVPGGGVDVTIWEETTGTGDEPGLI